MSDTVSLSMSGTVVTVSIAVDTSADAPVFKAASKATGADVPKIKTDFQTLVLQRAQRAVVLALAAQTQTDAQIDAQSAAVLAMKSARPAGSADPTV